MINKFNILFFLIILIFSVNDNAKAGEEFNFDITEIEILENGNLFKGKKKRYNFI